MNYITFMTFKTRILLAFIPFFCLLLMTPMTSWIDIAAANYFYTPSLEGKGDFFNNSLTHFLFDYGEKIGFVIAALTAAFYLLSWPFKRYKSMRRDALVFLLTLVLGAGIITNSLLKEYWGRPRPKQVDLFGGKHPFRPYYRPHFQVKEDPQKSFPSGHAAMGFWYGSLCIIGHRRRSTLLFWIGIILTLGFGVGLSLTRIVQGGHFVSDTLFSALIMWWSVLLVDGIATTWEGRKWFSKKDPKQSDTFQTLDAS